MVDIEPKVRRRVALAYVAELVNALDSFGDCTTPQALEALDACTSAAAAGDLVDHNQLMVDACRAVGGQAERALDLAISEGRDFEQLNDLFEAVDELLGREF